VNQNIALFGLGTLCAGMASNLRKAGFSLSVYNRTAAKAQPLTRADARPGFPPAEADRGAAVLFFMFAAGAASREIWTAENGALAAVAPGAILIESGLVSPGWRTQLAALAGAQSVELIDAPVTESPCAGRSWTTLFPCGWERKGALQAQSLRSRPSAKISCISALSAAAEKREAHRQFSPRAGA
jgi:3-hydroxyisobutyrate dehydrogenase